MAPAAEGGEADPAEEDGAELADVEAQLRLGPDARAPRGSEPPDARVPRAELVRDVDNDGAVPDQAPDIERGGQVDDAHPERVRQSHGEPPRLLEEKMQRGVEGGGDRLHPLDPVDRGEIPPDRVRRRSRVAGRLYRLQLADAVPVVELLVVP